MLNLVFMWPNYESQQYRVPEKDQIKNLVYKIGVLMYK